MTDEQMAQLFHEQYELLAPTFGYLTRPESRKPWSEVPAQNKALMVAVCIKVREALQAASAAPACYCYTPEHVEAILKPEGEPTQVKEEVIDLAQARRLIVQLRARISELQNSATPT